MPPLRTSRFHGLLSVVLLVVGLFFPSSTDAEPTLADFLVPCSLLGAILVLLLARPGGMRGALPFANVIGMNLLLGAFTLLTPFGELALGNYSSRVLLCLLYLVNLHGIEGGRWLSGAWTAVNLANLALGYAILFQVPLVSSWLVDHYSAFYPELVPTMLELGKPVLTFATHSLAGFFFYLFFYLNFTTYRIEGSLLHLVFALGFLVLSFFLKSVTVYGFAPIAAAQLAWHFGVRATWRSRLFAALVVLGVLGARYEQQEVLAEAGSEVVDILSSENSGLVARYGQGGVIAPSLEYIVEHPFQPIGLGNAVEFTNWDSGVIENMTRGSLPLVICVYGGLLGFLLSNLRSRSQALTLFFAYLAFEIGFANLLYLRTLYFLPFAVVYLNGLGTTEAGTTLAEAA